MPSDRHCATPSQIAAEHAPRRTDAPHTITTLQHRGASFTPQTPGLPGGLPAAINWEAADGIEAIDALPEHRYDVMLLDLSMPRMSGEDVVLWLHAPLDRAEGLRTVVVSAWAGRQARSPAEASLPGAGEAPTLAETDARSSGSHLSRHRWERLRHDPF